MQFNSTLQHILQCIAYCDKKHGLPLLAKVDLADGYYRIPLRASTALSLAVVIPNDIPNQPPLIAIPLTLPKGWAHSPPFFCAFTKTVTDITNVTATPHTIKHPLLTPSQAKQLPQQTQFSPDAVLLQQGSLPPLAYTVVYINDFMTVAQRPHHLQTLNTLLHSIESIFHDHPHTCRRPVISRSKLDKGDASFSTQKQILGWHIDTH
jgi:hypothetical protein